MVSGASGRKARAAVTGRPQQASGAQHKPSAAQRALSVSSSSASSSDEGVDDNAPGSSKNARASKSAASRGHSHKHATQRSVFSRPAGARVQAIDGGDANDNPSFKRFAEMLDDLVESCEQDVQQHMSRMVSGGGGGDESSSDSMGAAEIPAEYLLGKQTCSELLHEAFKLSACGLLSCASKDHLSKLQSMLYFNVRDGTRTLHDVSYLFMNLGKVFWFLTKLKSD